MNDKTENWWNDSIAFATRTDVGMRRSSNQDSHFVEPAATPRLWSSRGHVFVVADGMGAHAAGEYASELATTIIPQSYLKREDQSSPEALRDAILEAHETIRKRGASDEAFHEMGTTCDALALKPEGAYIGHVGDSRVYRLRDKTIEQLTFDHSLVWEVKYNKSVNPIYRQMANVPKNVITRSLGPTDNLVVAMEGPFPIKPGDVFLLCSDGLSGQLDDAVIGQTLNIFQPEEATEALVNLANLKGGPDNITVVVVRVKSLPKLEEAEREIEKANKLYERRPSLSLAAKTTLAIGVACLLATFGSLCLREHRAIVAGLLAVATCALFGAFAYLGRATLFARRERQSTETTRLGRGPYSRTSAVPTAEFCEYVDGVCNDLCDTIRAQPLFEPDWKGVANARAQARAAAEARDYASALRANLSVVNYIMRELKKLRGTKN